MFRKLAAAALIGMCAVLVLAFQASGSLEHPLFKSPSGYEIVKYSSGDGAMTFPAGALRESVSPHSRLGDGTLRFPIDPLYGSHGRAAMTGRLTEIFYYAWGHNGLTVEALAKRFLSSLRGAGGEVVFQENPALGGSVAVGRFIRPGRDVWVMQDVISRREYRLYILETPNRQADPRRDGPKAAFGDFETEAQVLDLLHTLDRAGRLDLPVRFSAGSSTLLVGYETHFRKFVMLMEKDPSLKFRVSAYTDQNLRPSDQRILLRGRAAALLDALISAGADEKRLTVEAPLGELMDSSVPAGFVRLTSVDSVEPDLR